MSSMRSASSRTRNSTPEKFVVALLHQIDQSARRRDHDLNARAQGGDLRTFAHSAKNRRHAQRQMLRVDPYVFLDLHDELPCRSDNQSLHPAAVSLACRLRKLRQNRQDKCRGLAGPGLRNTDNIAPGENFWNCRRLYRGGFRVASFLDGFKNAVIKTEQTKWHSPATIG